MTERVHPAAAVGFDQAADEYERARPSYPAAAVAFIVETYGVTASSRVLDLAAGTGKLTRLLVPTGATLVAVEPVAGMRRVLSGAVPAVEVLDGTAESIPVDDESVDLVACAQAFHWFDPLPALAEIRRVLRPGGGLAVVFNVRDESEPWVRMLTEQTGVETADRPHHTTTRRELAGWAEADGGYTAVEVERFRYVHEMTEDSLVERVASQSWIAAMPDQERGALLDGVRTLARTHPDLAGRERFAMPYDTWVLHCRRR